MSARDDLHARSTPTRSPQDTPAVVAVPALLSVATVARILDCSPQTVRRRVKEGRLPAVRDHGRLMVRGDDLRAYVDGMERIGVRPGRRPRGGSAGWDFLRA